MKTSSRFSGWLVLVVLAAALVAVSHWRPAPSSSTAESITAYFSPRGGCTEAVVREIESAKAQILVQAYSFTSPAIAQALVQAYRRGIDVRVILDQSQRTEKYSEADFLFHAGVPVAIDAKHAIAHNKVMLFDGQTVVTGSFNFTRSAEDSNAENLLVIRDAALAKRYIANWDAHAAHSELYQGKTDSDRSGASERNESRPAKKSSRSSSRPAA